MNIRFVCGTPFSFGEGPGMRLNKLRMESGELRMLYTLIASKNKSTHNSKLKTHNLMNSITTAQVSDTTMLNSSNTAGPKKNLCIFLCFAKSKQNFDKR